MWARDDSSTCLPNNFTLLLLRVKLDVQTNNCSCISSCTCIWVHISLLCSLYQILSDYRGWSVKDMLCILTCSCDKMFQDVHVCDMFSKVTFNSFNDSLTQDWLTLLWKADSQGVIPGVYVYVLISHILENMCMKPAKDHRWKRKMKKFTKFQRICKWRQKLDIIF